MEIFAKRLKELRQEKKIGQTALSNLLDMCNASISYYETDKQDPTVTNLIKLATYFDVSTDYLLGLTDEKTPSKPISENVDNMYTDDKTDNI